MIKWKDNIVLYKIDDLSTNDVKRLILNDINFNHIEEKYNDDRDLTNEIIKKSYPKGELHDVLGDLTFEEVFVRCEGLYGDDKQFSEDENILDMVYGKYIEENLTNCFEELQMR